MRATSYAIATRGWESLAGLVTLTLIGAFFTPEEQGYYYTFLGLLTLQTLADLGFSGVIQQFASHEWASPGRSPSRLSSLVRFAFTWYAAAGMIVALGLGAAGSVYFRLYAPMTSMAWEGVWWVSCALTGAGMSLTPALAILEGTNQVDKTYGIRLGQAISARVGSWVAILFGLGILTVAASRAAALVAGLIGIGRDGVRFLRAPAAEKSAPISWRDELWPLQWRFAASAAGGYLLFSLFTPVLFASHGPEVAGRMGMTLSAAAALASASFSCVATRVPRLAILAARGDFEEMDSVFFRAAALALAAAFVGAAGFCASVHLFSVLATRFLTVAETAILLLAMSVQQLRFAMGSYLRAHKAEPFAALHAIEGFAALAVLWPLGVHFGAMGMVTGFLALSLVTLVPAIVIFDRCRNAWHGASWVAAS